MANKLVSNVLLFLFSTVVSRGGPNYQIVGSHSMDVPVGKEYNFFKTLQSSVFLKDKIVLVPELKDKKGIIYSKYAVKSENQQSGWIMSINLQIGNSIRSDKGGGGVGIHYLRSLKKSSFGDGLFGYSKEFDGLGVYLNSMLSTPGSDGGYENYIQAHFNANDRQIDHTEAGKNFCTAKFRNLQLSQHENGKQVSGDFNLVIKYNNKQVSINYIDREQMQEVNCITIQQDLDYDGAWLISAGSGFDDNPDYTFISNMHLYDMSHEITQQQQEQQHDQHQKQAIIDMAKFNEEHIAKDLIHHSDKSQFNKEQFGQKNLLAMLPEQLRSVKRLMYTTIYDMKETIGYYAQVSGPLRGHKNLDERLMQVYSMNANMTNLSNLVTDTKSEIELLQINEVDYALEEKKLSETDKSKQFEDGISELQLSFKLMHKKAGVLQNKLLDFHKLSDQTDGLILQIESYKMGIIKNKKDTYHKSSLVTSEERDEIRVNLAPIDSYFDEIEQSEAKSQLLILLTIPNMLLAVVIGMCCWIWVTLHNLSKNRVD